MDPSRADAWRTARFNQHMHRALAERSRRWDLWSSVVVAVGSSGSVLAVVGTHGGAWPTAAALACAVAIATRPLFKWGEHNASHRAAWLAWRGVEDLCADSASAPEIAAAERAAQRMDPAAMHAGFDRLREWAYGQTCAELPAERFA